MKNIKLFIEFALPVIMNVGLILIAFGALGILLTCTLVILGLTVDTSIAISAGLSIVSAFVYILENVEKIENLGA